MSTALQAKRRTYLPALTSNGRNENDHRDRNDLYDHPSGDKKVGGGFGPIDDDCEHGMGK
eukprot:2215904-Alexandrium_andersonii.AAC.1